MARSIVSIVKTAARPNRSEIAAAVREAVALAGGLPDAVRPGATVLLKPNLVEVPRTFESGAVTHPDLCRAVAELVRERGAAPIIADSAGVGSDTEAVISFMGYEALRRDGFTVLDLKRSKVIRVNTPASKVLPAVHIYEPALNADAIINLPVMKTHDQAEVTLSLKNLKGLIADRSKKAMHRRGLFQGIPEMAEFFKPCLTVLDGIYAQEGVGPVFGDPVEMDLVMAGVDMVALDTIAGLIMGYRPEEVPTTRLAAASGLGAADPALIKVTGRPWETVYRRFKRCSESEILSESLPCRLVIGNDACTGCRNTVIAVLVELQEREMLPLLRGKTIIAGRPSVTETSAEEVYVGTCARNPGGKGAYVAGCPPENSCVIKALTGS